MRRPEILSAPFRVIGGYQVDRRRHEWARIVEFVGKLRQRMLERTGHDPAQADVIETTDRTVFRLVMAANALGLGQPSEVADALIEGRLPRLQPSGGLFRRNAGYAAGLERIVCAAEAVERGALSALAHSSYGRAGQGHSLTVLGAPS